MGPGLNRGEVWLAPVGAKTRPVVILTRTHVLDVRQLVTVAEITTSIRGLHSEVSFDHLDVGLNQPSVVNCDGLHTMRQKDLSGPIGFLDSAVMESVCSAVSWAIGC